MGFVISLSSISLSIEINQTRIARRAIASYFTKFIDIHLYLVHVVTVSCGCYEVTTRLPIQGILQARYRLVSGGMYSLSRPDTYYSGEGGCSSETRIIRKKVRKSFN